jgi:hypothetical protein
MPLKDYLDDENGLTRYSPRMDGKDFNSADQALLNSSSITISDFLKEDSENFILGQSKDGKTLKLDKYEPCCYKKLPFISRHGTIGPNGTFPHVGEYPEYKKDIPHNHAKSCYGPNYKITAEASSETFITIGPTATSWNSNSDQCDPSCYPNIYAKNIGSPSASKVKIDDVIQIEGKEAFFHKGTDVSILVTKTKVQIFPNQKRKLHISPCSSDISRSTESKAKSADVFYADSHYGCVEKICEKLTRYNISNFTRLIEKI